jgi:hypothetical protein
VKACADSRAGEGFRLREAVANLGQDGHERRRPLDAGFARIGEREVANVPARFFESVQGWLLK